MPDLMDIREGNSCFLAVLRWSDVCYECTKRTVQVTAVQHAPIFSISSSVNCSLQKLTSRHTAGDDSAARMLFSHGVLGADTEIFQLSQFSDDLSMEACSRMISQLRLAIERGKKIFMMYTEPIHGSFYDLFNQFFTVRRDMQDQQEVVTLYVNIAIGPYSRPCRVHPRTQIMVHTPARYDTCMYS